MYQEQMGSMEKPPGHSGELKHSKQLELLRQLEQLGLKIVRRLAHLQYSAGRPVWSGTRGAGWKKRRVQNGSSSRRLFAIPYPDDRRVTDRLIPQEDCGCGRQRFNLGLVIHG